MVNVVSGFLAREVIQDGKRTMGSERSLIDQAAAFSIEARTGKNGIDAWSLTPGVSVIPGGIRTALGLAEVVAGVVLAPFYLLGMLFAPIDNGKNLAKSLGLALRGVIDLGKASLEFAGLIAVGNLLIYGISSAGGASVSDKLDKALAPSESEEAVRREQRAGAGLEHEENDQLVPLLGQQPPSPSSSQSSEDQYPVGQLLGGNPEAAERKTPTSRSSGLGIRMAKGTFHFGKVAVGALGSGVVRASNTVGLTALGRGALNLVVSPERQKYVADLAAVLKA